MSVMKRSTIIPEFDMREYINSIYTFILLLTSNTHAAEEITIKVITEEYFNNSSGIKITRCLKNAYRKCSKYDYISGDDCLMKRLAVLTLSERGLVLLKYGYKLSENYIGEIMKINKTKVKPLTRQALEKMMRSGEDGCMFVSECRHP